MKIAKIETFILRVPLGKERFYSSQCAFPERNSLLVRIETDEGIHGWGEGGQYGPPEPPEACIKHVFAPMLLGKDPLKRGVLWDLMYSMTRDFGQKGAYIDAISAIDIALWDIAGKECGKSVAELLGGAFRTGIHAYATGCYYRGEDYLDYRKNLPALSEEAASYARAGFGIVKGKIGLLPIEQDLERLAAIRKAVGPDVKILIDANHAYNSGTAYRLCAELEKIGNILWFEEPIPPEDYDGYAMLRKGSPIPIAGGECEFTRFGFRELFTRGCVDIAQPDICACGGFSELKNIQALASAFGIPIVPHTWGSAVALAAALQFIATLPPFPHTANPVPIQNEPVVEFDRNPNALRDELAGGVFKLENGKLKVPEGPGLGIKVNEEILRKYSGRS